MAKKKTIKRKTAKRSGGPNKAAAVRDYVNVNPRASNDQVVAALEGQGISVTPNYVSVVKSQDRARSRTGGTKTKRGRTGANSAGVGLDEVKQAASLIRSCGGIEKAKAAIAAAEDVARALEAR